MSVFAAVMTGRGTGAISTIEVFGERTEAVIKKVFKPAGGKSSTFKTGKILLGTITDGGETIDQVTIGCEGTNNFAINCHGNPLIVEMIMQLLQRHGVKLITADELLAKVLAAQEPVNTIALEAKLTQPKAKTIEGTKIISNQIDGGLSKKAEEWLQSVSTMSPGRIKAEVAHILGESQKAKLIIGGCTAVITGPPNSGKSTLFNYLCGKQKAIVTDIKGTTRDWVGARCKIGPLCVELIDTAGFDEQPGETGETGIEKAAQEKALEILANADLVLLVLDNSVAGERLDERLLGKMAGKKTLTILNKSDLNSRFDMGRLPKVLRDTMHISAKFGTGIETLLKRIPQVVGAADFDLKSAVCITGRQENLLKQLQAAKSREQAVSIITELLNGRLNV